MIAQMAARLNAQRTLERALDTILADSVALVGAKHGLIRLLDETGSLVIVAQRGFDRHFLMSMRRLTLSAGTGSARAAANRMTILVPDVDKDRLFAPYREFSDRIGIRAFLSTPMITHAEGCVGVISTHFDQTHEATLIEQRMLETYAKIAADRLVNLLSGEPKSIRAHQLFDRALASAASKMSAAPTRYKRRPPCISGTYVLFGQTES
jgi:GAF domain-containing protein